MNRITADVIVYLTGKSATSSGNNGRLMRHGQLSAVMSAMRCFV